MEFLFVYFVGLYFGRLKKLWLNNSLRRKYLERFGAPKEIKKLLRWGHKGCYWTTPNPKIVSCPNLEVWDISFCGKRPYNRARVYIQRLNEDPNAHLIQILGVEPLDENESGWHVRLSSKLYDEAISQIAMGDGIPVRDANGTPYQ